MDMQNLRGTALEFQAFQCHKELNKIEADLKMVRARMIAVEEMIKANLDASQKIMETNRAKMTANEEKNETKLDAATNTVQEMCETTMKTDQEKMWTTIRAGQEEMTTTIRAILSAQAEFQETISTVVTSIMASVDQQTHTPCEEPNTVMEKLRTPTEATRREPKPPVAEVGTPVWRTGSRNAVPCAFSDGPWSSRGGKGRKELHVCWRCGDCAPEMHQKQSSERDRQRREERVDVTENRTPVPLNPSRRDICVPGNHRDHNLNAEGRIRDKSRTVQQ